MRERGTVVVIHCCIVRRSSVMAKASRCSLDGFGGWRDSGPYCASKFAVEAVSDALRRELLRFDIAVSLIEPGTRAERNYGESGRAQERGTADWPVLHVLTMVLGWMDVRV